MIRAYVVCVLVGGRWGHVISFDPFELESVAASPIDNFIEPIVVIVPSRLVAHSFVFALLPCDELQIAAKCESFESIAFRLFKEKHRYRWNLTPAFVCT